MRDYHRYSIIFLCILAMSFMGHGRVSAKKRFHRFKVARRLKLGKKAKYRRVYDKKFHRIRYYDDKVIVKFKKGTNSSEREAYFNTHGLSPIKKLAKRTYHCELAQIQIIENDKAIQNLLNIEEDDTTKIVESLDIDEYRELKIEKRKKGKGAKAEFFGSQWHLNNDGENGLKEGADINITEAWAYSMGLGMKVAVIDTGFDLDHEDINYASTGYDVVKDQAGAGAPIKSNENHGTAVAGIIAAKNNRYGVTGVAPDSQIIPIRLISDDGMVSISQIIAAHRKAVELGATIINNSWGSYDPSLKDGEQLNITSSEDELYKELATEANNGKGVLVIFASGNSGENNFDNAPEARNQYNMAVGATDSTDQRASYSVWGDQLDLVAPGGGAKAIVTTDRSDVRIKRKKGKARRFIMGYSKGNYTKSFKGTSAAAPVVAGIAALVWAANPALTAEEVKEILRDTADKNVNDRYEFDANGRNPEIGYGRVDAEAAVKAAIDY